MSNNQKTHIRELVINWHLTEACNYTCRYCYASWCNPSKNKEIIHDQAKVLKILFELKEFFQSSNMNNPLTEILSWDTIRLNLAGGEPLLYETKTIGIIEQAKAIGFNVSIITNGSFLSEDTIHTIAPHLSWLGISIDSSNVETNLSIGRKSRQGTVLDIDDLTKNIAAVRQCNSDLKLKINTVVNKLNHSENMNSIITRLNPNKWKVLQMLPVHDDSLSITQEQYLDFVRRHAVLNNKISIEDNEHMSQSYLMIDPLGRFYQNSTVSSGYQYSRPIPEIGAQEAFQKIDFSADKFCSRYQ